MPEEPARYQVGDIGDNAVVQVGENLYHYDVSVNVQNAKEAEGLLRLLREKGARPYYGPLLRRLDPVVLINRQQPLTAIEQFLKDPNFNTIYILGLAAIGKSTLVRGALEYRPVDTPAVWVTSEGLDADKLLADLNSGLSLDLSTIVNDPKAVLSEKLAAVLGSIQVAGILVLDGFEAVLDDDGNYRSARMSEAMEALTTSEHKLKVLITTRRLPYGVGEGSPNVEILRLGGLSKEMSVDLLRRRSNLTTDQVTAMLPPEALAKLHGHPKFIELFASAIAEAPVQEVLQSLLLATDIGQFIKKQILGQLGQNELAVLKASAVFRDTFTFESLNAICTGDEMLPSLRVLIRRAILDPVGEPGRAYYLHPLLRDAVPDEPEQMAAGHGAAANWFLNEPFDASDPKTWDEGLYHLRRAAELDPKGRLANYSEFLFKNRTSLNYAGWGRRLVSEFTILTELTPTMIDSVIAGWCLGLELWQLNDYDEAEAMFRELIAALNEVAKVEKELGREEDSNAADMLVLVKQKLADSLLKRDKIDEAERLAEEIEPIANASNNIQYQLRYRELRFALARNREDENEMLSWAKETLSAAEQWEKEEPSPQTQDAVAEAHFGMGVSYLRFGDTENMLKHFFEQLRIKIAIGKLSGVAAGLSNVGVILKVLSTKNQEQMAWAIAMIIASDQIQKDVGSSPGRDPVKTDPIAIQTFLNDPNSIAVGREAIGVISKELLPYYERALLQK